MNYQRTVTANWYKPTLFQSSTSEVVRLLEHLTIPGETSCNPGHNILTISFAFVEAFSTTSKTGLDF